MMPFTHQPAAGCNGLVLLMMFSLKPWSRGLALALPLAVLLTACDKSDKPVTPPAAPHTTYTQASWEALPAVSEADLQAGFAAWRSACVRLKADAVWGPTCAAAASVAVAPDATQIRTFLQGQLQVYSLRADGGSADGLITGYYEPVYPGSLTQTATANVPVYGIPDDLIVVNLDSIYPELKGKRLRGRLEGRVLKPYDDAATINAQGLNAPVIAWLTDPMDVQFLQIQGSGRVSLEDGSQLRLATPIRTVVRTAPSAVGWWSRAS